MSSKHFHFCAIFPLALTLHIHAQSVSDESDTVELTDYTVYGRADSLVGKADTASQGQVGAGELAVRPFLRRGELLEVVPGLVVTQHSGGGKANQYFLRGFNLDHGTDFALSTEGVPINMRTHGHGQGYADVNFVIPEMVESIAFNKGPFFGEVGDFSAAGATDIRLFKKLPHNFATVSVGEDSYYRAAFGITTGAGKDGTLTLAAEGTSYDGPFVLPENFGRLNGLLRFHSETNDRSLTFTVMAYDAGWDSTDQIPLRAVQAGALSRFGTVDTTDGGESRRYGIGFSGTWPQSDGETRINAYATRHHLDLFSNFTYLLDDPVDGDQFEQVDKRWVAGTAIEREWRNASSNRDSRLTVGLQTRSDFIDEVGLHKASARRRSSTVRSDEVDEHSAGLFVRHEMTWSERLRTVAGLRGDYYSFDVDSDLAVNSGTENDFVASPKLSVIFTAAKNTEIYASAGSGFHSNDARGTTITIDPASGDPASRVDPLVQSKGAEIGVRVASVKGLVSSLAVFALEVDSELLFVGDAGNTEASGRTRRTGVEFANFYQPLPWLAIDADVALTHSRFRNAGPEGDRIPGAIDTAISAGVVVGQSEGAFGSVRARYFGPRTLIEDGSVEGESSLLFNARLGFRRAGWEFAVDVLNVFDREDNDIEYLYESRLAGEPAEGVTDIHFHPVEPRTFRISASHRF